MNAVDYVKQNGIEKSRIHLEKMKVERWINSFFNDLKQIVDAFELVDKFGGIDKSKRILKKAYESCSQIILDSRKNIETTWNDLNDAINLVEQCNA